MKQFLMLLLAGLGWFGVLDAQRALSATVIVNMSGYQFVPRDLTINVGDTVTWTNLDFTTHDTVSGVNGIPSNPLIWKSPLFGFGGRYSFTFTNTPVGKRIPYYCTPHWRTFGMIGSITVVVPNAPPLVSIDSPTNGASFIAGDDVFVQAFASDSDGTVARVDLSVNGNLLLSLTNPPYTMTLTNIAVGSYSLSAVAVDNQGASSSPAVVNFGVGPPVPPAIISQPQNLVVRVGASNAFAVVATGVPPPTYQWRFENNDIPGATNSVYQITNSQPTDAGTYSVIVSNRAGFTNSQPATLRLDSTPPTFLLTTSPPNFDRRRSSQITLAGTANDDIGLAQVELIINGATNLAVGTTNWVFTNDLPAGPNAILLHSVDLAGNVSSDDFRFFTYVVEAPLTVRTNGPGSVTPDLDDRDLEIGQVYGLRAVPGFGFIFGGWEGVANSNYASVNFVMQSNLVLTANFISNPFATINGTYAGLFYDTNGVASKSSGFFSLHVDGFGAFSGGLVVDGGRSLFRGRFDAHGHVKVPVLRRQLAPVVLTLNLDLSNTTGRMDGQVTAGQWSAELRGDRCVFPALASSPLPTGAGPFLLRRHDNSMEIARGVAKINPFGRVRLRGSLSDGPKFNMTTFLTPNGDCPFYVSLQVGSETMIGWLNFANVSTPVYGTNLFWVSSGTNGFSFQLDALSAQP
ncbi:MAG: immunoglobulin domain-containing protein [Verrucomicrobia bacterium]|nr:immunoglobulin domain-containing protein [Verrucomicrobiota bacterium]